MYRKMIMGLVIFIAANAQTLLHAQTLRETPTSPTLDQLPRRLHRQGKHLLSHKHRVWFESQKKLQDEQIALLNGVIEERKNYNEEQLKRQKEALRNMVVCHRPHDLSNVGIDVAKLKELVKPTEPQTYSTSEFKEYLSGMMITDFEPSACLDGYDGTVKVSCSAEGKYTVDVNTCSTCNFGDKSKCNGAVGCIWEKAADGAEKCFVKTLEGTPCAEKFDYKGETYSHCIGMDSYRPWCKRANGSFDYCVCEKIPDPATCHYMGCYWPRKKGLPTGCKTRRGNGEECNEHRECASRWCTEGGLCGSEPDGLVKLFGAKKPSNIWAPEGQPWDPRKPPAGGNCNSHKECEVKGTNFFCNIFRVEDCDDKWCPPAANTCEPMPEIEEGVSVRSSDDFTACPFAKCREGFSCICNTCRENDGDNIDNLDSDTAVDDGVCYEFFEPGCLEARGYCEEGQFCDLFSQRFPTCKEIAGDGAPEDPAKPTVGLGKCVLRITTGCAKHEGTHGTVKDFTFTRGENKPDGDEYETWSDAVHSVGFVAGIKVYGGAECKAHFVFNKNRISQNNVTMITEESPLSILCDADDPTELRRVSDLWTVDQDLRPRPQIAPVRGSRTLCTVYRYDGCDKKKDEHMSYDNQIEFPFQLNEEEFANVELLSDKKTMGVRIEAPLPGRETFCEVKLKNDDGTTETIKADGDIHCIEDVTKIQCALDPTKGTSECGEEDYEDYPEYNYGDH